MNEHNKSTQISNKKISPLKQLLHTTSKIGLYTDTSSKIIQSIAMQNV